MNFLHRSFKVLLLCGSYLDKIVPVIIYLYSDLKWGTRLVSKKSIITGKKRNDSSVCLLQIGRRFSLWNSSPFYPFCLYSSCTYVFACLVIDKRSCYDFVIGSILFRVTGIRLMVRTCVLLVSWKEIIHFYCR